MKEKERVRDRYTEKERGRDTGREGETQTER